MSRAGPRGWRASPFPRRAFTAGIHLLLALVLTGGLAIFIWLVAG